jgi:hypothetical protein
MAKPTAAVRYALAAFVALGAAVLVARSPRARASFRAAYVAFRDPSRVRETDRGAGDDDVGTGARPGAPVLEQPDLAVDFGRVDEAELADSGVAALASLVMPDMRLAVTPRTVHFVGYFAGTGSGREAFGVRFRRAGRYRRFVEQALRDAELPEDLVWLCAIASGFEPQATSPKGAAGLFQFMPDTAARYGLVQSEVIDERRSVPRSTAAGVALLRDLFDAYGRWDLALAAYHLGRERLDEAIARLRERRGAREANKPVDLEDLSLARLVPKETANFVPQVQAFAIVAANRGRFGLDDLDPALPFDFGEIAVPAGTPLKLVARAAGVSVAVMRDYNPSLLRDQTPPEGGDTLVSLPADRVAGALAAFPPLYAREMAKLVDAGADATAPPAATARASASGSQAGPLPALDRFTLANGVVVERHPPVATSAPGEVTVAARIEVTRGASAGKGGIDVAPIVVRSSELDAAVERAAHAVRVLVADGGEAAALARRSAGEGRRQRLSRAPYGRAWLAIGERLFGASHPLTGTVLLTPAMPLTSVAIAEPPPGPEALLRVTVTVAATAERATIESAAARAFAAVLEPSKNPVALHPREDRVELSEAVPSPRVAIAWLAPAATEVERAALRATILAIAHNEVGKVARALVAEKHVAAHVRGFLDLGDRASVAALEVVPAVPHNTADVEAEIEASLAALGEHGLSSTELSAVKAQHRARVQGERAHVGTTGEPREAALARLARVSELVDAVASEDIAAVVRRVFVPGHRVVVVTTPR